MNESTYSSDNQKSVCNSDENDISLHQQTDAFFFIYIQNEKADTVPSTFTYMQRFNYS